MRLGRWYLFGDITSKRYSSLVSTGKSIQEQEEYYYQLRREQEQREHEALQRIEAQARASRNQAIAEQNALIASGDAIINGDLIWSTKNAGASNVYDKGVAYLEVSCSDNWRVPTEREFKSLLSESIKRGSYYEHPSGLIIPFGGYAIQRNDGAHGYIILPDKIVSSGDSPTFVRLVKSKIN